MTLQTLSDAIEWAQSRWQNQRAVPVRLHTREEEGVGLGFTQGFSAALNGSPSAIVSQTRTVDCFHPLLPKGRPARDCPECIGTKVKDVRSDLYAYPMTLALNRLSNSLRPMRQPHPYVLVLALASHGWRARQAARSLQLPWDRAEPLLLMALRKLHSRYEEGPTPQVSSSWVDFSDAQRNAIQHGETAA